MKTFNDYFPTVKLTRQVSNPVLLTHSRSCFPFALDMAGFDEPVETAEAMGYNASQDQLVPGATLRNFFRDHGYNVHFASKGYKNQCKQLGSVQLPRNGFIQLQQGAKKSRTGHIVAIIDGVIYENANNAGWFWAGKENFFDQEVTAIITKEDWHFDYAANEKAYNNQRSFISRRRAEYTAALAAIAAGA